MTVRGFLNRVAGQLIGKAAGEGEWRPGPYYLPISGGWLPAGSPDNFWQLGMNPVSAGASSPMVEACISAYSQTIAACPGDHWRATDDGGRERVENSALTRILRQPNEYQTISDFMLNATRALYLEGNCYALALRNDRFEIDELHLMDSNVSFPRVAENGEVFYQLDGNDIIEKRLNGEALAPVPVRDVLHIRLHTSRRFPRPLMGESPLVATYGDIGIGAAIAEQQAMFYRNQARPSAILGTDLVLSREQVQDLRDRWNDQAKGLHQGGTPILTAGLKVQPWTVGGKDAATADILKLSSENIALAFRIPLQILGIGSNTYSSTEELMRSWYANSLNFALNHIEESFGVLFELDGQPDEYLEFDTAALLRSAYKDRIEALVRAVQGGVVAIDEARELEGYGKVPGGFGKEPRVQQQLVPLSAAAAIPAAPGPPGAPPAEAAEAPKQLEKPAPKVDAKKFYQALKAVNSEAA